MSKKVSEILNSDIQVPEIVQKKADVAFSQIQSERETNMGKKNLKVTKLCIDYYCCIHNKQLSQQTAGRKRNNSGRTYDNRKREYVYHESNGGTGRSDGTEACSNRTK